MKVDSNTAKIFLNSKKSEIKKLNESTERLIQKFTNCKDAKEKERLLLIIRRNNPDFKPVK